MLVIICKAPGRIPEETQFDERAMQSVRSMRRGHSEEVGGGITPAQWEKGRKEL